MDDFRGVDMNKGTCSVTECDRPVRSRGWCHAHYMFWYQNRTEPAGPVRPWGQKRIKTCQVQGCENPYYVRDYCAAHYKRVQAHGEPGEAEIRPRTVGDDADYTLVHLRLAKRRGSASRRECVRCSGPAQHWAYDHTDPDERIDPRGYAFSVNLDHYLPMCARCHKRFDIAYNSQSQQADMDAFAAIRQEL